MLGNIDPKFQSSVQSIQLVAVLRTQLIETYTVNEVLKPFMTDIKQLESVGFCGTIMHAACHEMCGCMKNVGTCISTTCNLALSFLV